MPLSRSRDYMSIGEVLEALRAEFPDVSISKIRFLESEGLITPERTGSGYRKFYDTDVARLRYILALQRDHFLPLRVIRQKLAEADSNGAVPAPAPPEPDASFGRAPSPDLTDVQMSREELLRSVGLSPTQAAALDEFGILPERDDGNYGGEDVVIAKTAKAMLDRGLEARHLKMYRQFAEREAAFFEQLAGPAALRRHPEGRREAASSAAQLTTLAGRLHDALVRSALKDVL